jgi:hypothetical protein
VSAVKSYEIGGQMMHATIRATLMPEILRLISEKYGCDEKEAMDCFYNSATGASFSDDDIGLYGQSALYNFGLYVDEIENTKLQVKLSGKIKETFKDADFINTLTEVLQLDPRPSYHNDPNRIYGMLYGNYNVKFTVKEDILEIIEIE